MAVTFWDTIRGTRLADTLIRELPKLTERRKQHAVTYDKDESLADTINYMIDTGKQVDQVIDLGDKVVCIFSKPD